MSAHNDVLRAVDNGHITAQSMLEIALRWMGEDEIKEMCEDATDLDDGVIPGYQELEEDEGEDFSDWVECDIVL